MLQQPVREIVEMAQGLDNVLFLPVQPMEEFRHLMIAADIHLLPQRAEAADLVMPSKLGNILATGRPVVAGAKAGTQVYDAVQGCGIAVPPDDADRFAQAVGELAADPARRAEMGQAARERALAQWGQEPALEKLEFLFTRNDSDMLVLGPNGTAIRTDSRGPNLPL